MFDYQENALASSQKTVEEAEKLTNAQVVEELEGLPPQKMHCSVLAEEAIQEAIKDYRSKQAQ